MPLSRTGHLTVTATSGVHLPFLTLSDPQVAGEGSLDPLGLSPISERLAERILPGLRARMSRPRFLTAMAVASVVCEGLEDFVAADGVTPPYLVFEWLTVEAFARCADRSDTIRTPGSSKAQTAKEAGEPMCARAYLRIPTVFGYHGVYKPLARNLGIVDDDFRLADNGYALLKDWELDQNLPGFLRGSTTTGAGTSLRDTLHSAVKESLAVGFSKRSAGWQGWRLLADHLPPAKIGGRERARLHSLLLGGEEIRGELFTLLQRADSDLSEPEVTGTFLLPRAKEELRRRLQSIAAFEEFATLLEDAFDYIRYLSTAAGARPITAADFSENAQVQRIHVAVPAAAQSAERALENAPLATQEMFGEIARAFYNVPQCADLFEAVLSRHSEVQRGKPPEGKRDWFERAADGKTFIRPPYQIQEPAAERGEWNRPYRLRAAQSFLADLRDAR